MVIVHARRLGAQFTWSSTEAAPSDHTAQISVRRLVQAPQLLSDDLEPTKCLSLSVQQHLSTLKAAVVAARQGPPAQAQPSSEQKAAARACASIQQALKFVPAEVAAAKIIPDLQHLAKKAKSLVPSSAALRSAPDNGPRQDGDRVLNPIQGGAVAKKRQQQRRRRKRQQQQQEGRQQQQKRVLSNGQQLLLTQRWDGKWVCKTFSKVQQPGRPAKRGRGLMHMVGGKRLRTLRQ